MMMGEFVTLIQPKLPVKVVVLNNGTLGFVEMEMKASGFLDAGCDLTNPEFRRHGRGDGHQGHPRRASRGPGGRALREAFAHRRAGAGGCGVSARQELVMPPNINFEEAKNFGLFMIKAVLDGRLAQLTDLAGVNLRR